MQPTACTTLGGALADPSLLNAHRLLTLVRLRSGLLAGWEGTWVCEANKEKALDMYKVGMGHGSQPCASLC